mmetsp:Transcript_2288/g.5635  ORF Transcript_2288/g.5635 Transcript_2288/m.5635 type:complete len:202 (-) Transcript_2288:769-1374(-)
MLRVFLRAMWARLRRIPKIHRARVAELMLLRVAKSADDQLGRNGPRRIEDASGLIQASALTEGAGSINALPWGGDAQRRQRSARSANPRGALGSCRPKTPVSATGEPQRRSAQCIGFVVHWPTVHFFWRPTVNAIRKLISIDALDDKVPWVANVSARQPRGSRRGGQPDGAIAECEVPRVVGVDLPRLHDLLWHRSRADSK